MVLKYRLLLLFEKKIFFVSKFYSDKIKILRDISLKAISKIFLKPYRTLRHNQIWVSKRRMYKKGWMNLKIPSVWEGSPFYCWSYLMKGERRTMTAVMLPRMPAQQTAGSVKLLESQSYWFLSYNTATFHVINKVFKISFDLMEIIVTLRGGLGCSE